MAHIKVARRSMDTMTWSKVNISQLDSFIVKQVCKIPDWTIRSGEYFPDGYVWDDEAFETINENDRWGGPDVTSIFKATFTIPESLHGQKLHFHMMTATEVLVKINGTYIDGLDPNRTSFPFIESAVAGETLDIVMEAYTRSKPDDDRNLKTNRLKGCIQHFDAPALFVIDDELLSLKYDLDVLFDLAFDESVDEPIRDLMEKHMNKVLCLLPHFESDRQEFIDAIPRVKEYFNEHIYYQFGTYQKQGNLALVAHSHLDIAYHWTAKQTVQKNARTALIQLRLMDRHPDFKYAHSQAWCYEMLEEYYPDMFEEVKQRIAEGRWEIVGGMYVEPDCNLISAESHVRQLLYGKKYFQEKFNVDVDNCWLPDVFGNSPIMPQILKKAGVDYFVSNKMSTWNDTNMFPYNNFIWKGLDGTEIFASVPPVHFITWGETVQATENWENYKEKEIHPESLQMYGYGDGGSGANDEMIELLKRQEMLPGIPKQRFTTGKEYLESTFAGDKNFPVWDGDLYLEMHRGTFTTKGDLKKINRKSEFLAWELETYSTLSYIYNKQSWQNELITPWKKLLVNQFHDILPGSHTTPVAVEALETYDKMNTEFMCIKDEITDSLLEPSTGTFTILNPSIQSRHGIAYLATDSDVECRVLTDKDGQNYPVQYQVNPTGEKRLATYVPNVDGLDCIELEACSQAVEFETSMKVTTRSLENKFYSIELNDNGEIIKLFDKIHSRDVATDGEVVNQWALYDDRPGKYNAWDILENYKDYPLELNHWENIQIVENGPISIALKMERTLSKSKACQIIRLFADHPRVDFETWVDWHEDQKLLKVFFPVDVKSRIYETDTSAGVLERYNNKNTTWEQARFEVPCHKWVNMSEGLFGVSLLNDCKYGCNVEDNVIGLSLLRAPIRPDRDSDRKEHYFTYSLMTHGGQWQQDNLVEEAYELNWPLNLLPGVKPKSYVTAPLSIDTKALQSQAFKLSEDGNNDIILRLVETYGSKGVAKIDFTIPVKEVFLCNLMEDVIESIPVENNTVVLPYKPNEILSIRIKKN